MGGAGEGRQGRGNKRIRVGGAGPARWCVGQQETSKSAGSLDVDAGGWEGKELGGWHHKVQE